MKNRVFIALSLAVGLALPALAQPLDDCSGPQAKDNQYCLQVVADRTAQLRPNRQLPTRSLRAANPLRPASRPMILALASRCSRKHGRASGGA